MRRMGPFVMCSDALGRPGAAHQLWKHYQSAFTASPFGRAFTLLQPRPSGELLQPYSGDFLAVKAAKAQAVKDVKLRLFLYFAFILIFCR